MGAVPCPHSLISALLLLSTLPYAIHKMINHFHEFNSFYFFSFEYYIFSLFLKCKFYTLNFLNCTLNGSLLYYYSSWVISRGSIPSYFISFIFLLFLWMFINFLWISIFYWYFLGNFRHHLLGKYWGSKATAVPIDMTVL